MSEQTLIAIDAVTLIIVVFGMYFPRYRRREVAVAILGLNVGVLAIATVLATATVSAGLGLGLFGVLSIIRLRSEELDYDEISYLFAALALGLLGGIPADPSWLSPVLMGAIVVTLFIGDHPKVFATSRRQLVTLDAAFTDEDALAERLELLLGGQVQRMKVQRVDLINDMTVVDVRFRLGSGSRR